MDYLSTGLVCYVSDHQKDFDMNSLSVIQALPFAGKKGRKSNLE
jgi:hypothetical protein